MSERRTERKKKRERESEKEGEKERCTLCLRGLDESGTKKLKILKSPAYMAIVHSSYFMSLILQIQVGANVDSTTEPLHLPTSSPKRLSLVSPDSSRSSSPPVSSVNPVSNVPLRTKPASKDTKDDASQRQSQVSESSAASVVIRRPSLVAVEGLGDAKTEEN